MAGFGANSQASLKRLQSLNSTFDQVEARLEEAARICGIQLDRNSSPSASGHRISLARTEWVLRWLSQRLQDTSRDFASLYLRCPTTWILLARTVEVLPETTSARLLQECKVLKSVKSAFNMIAVKPNAAQPAHSIESDTPSYAPPNGSNKRKRSERESASSFYSIDPGSTLATQLSIPDDETHAVYPIANAITIFLETLIKKSNAYESGGDPIAAERLKSVLRLDPADAIDLLAITLSLLDSQLVQQKQLTLGLLHAITHIWRARSSIRDDYNSLFTSKALKYAARFIGNTSHDELLYRLGTKRKAGSANKSLASVPSPWPSNRGRDTSSVLDIIDGLIEDHILSPGRHAFYERRSQDDASHAIMIHQLAALMLPIHKELFGNDLTKERSLESPFLEAIAYLFELALKPIRKSSSKPKKSQIAWIEAVFEVLSACAGEPLSEIFGYREVTAEMSATISPFAIEAMLKIADDSGISLSPNFLSHIVLKYSGLIQTLVPAPGPVRWPLTSRILKMDGDLFVGEETFSERLAALNMATRKYSKEIFGYISSLRRAPSNLTDPEAVKEEKEEVLLVQAYADSKELPSFIWKWFNDFIDAAEALAPADLERLPWASTELSNAVGELVRKTLNPTQIERLLKIYIYHAANSLQFFGIKDGVDEAITRLKPEAPELMHGQKDQVATVYACVIVLNSILSFVTVNEITVKVAEDLQTLFLWFQQILDLELDDFPLAYRIWHTLTTIKNLQKLLYPPRELTEDGSQGLVPGIFDVAKRSMEKRRTATDEFTYKTATSAFHFILACGEMMKDDAAVVDTVRPALQQAIQILIDYYHERQLDRNITTTESQLLLSLPGDLSLLAAYPYILTTKDQGMCQKLYNCLICWPLLVTDPDDELLLPLARILNPLFLRLQQSLLYANDSASHVGGKTRSTRLAQVMITWTSSLQQCLAERNQIASSSVKKAISETVNGLFLKLPWRATSIEVQDQSAQLLVNIDEHVGQSGTLFRAISVLHRMIRQSKTPDILKESPTPLWEIAMTLDGKPNIEESMAFDDFAGIILRSLALHITDESSVAYFKMFDKIVESVLKQLKPEDRSLLRRPSSLALITNRIDVASKAKELDISTSSIKEVVSVLIADLTSMLKPGFDVETDVDRISLERLVTAAQLVCDSKSGACDNEKLIPLLNKATRFLSSLEPIMKNAPSIGLVASAKTVDLMKTPNWTDKSEEEKIAMTCVAVAAYSNLPARSCLEFLGAQLNTGQITLTNNAILFKAFSALDSITEKQLKDTKYRVLRSRLLESFSGRDTSESELVQMRKVLPELAMSVSRAGEVVQVGYGLTDVLHILRHKPFMVSQFGVECILSMMVHMLTPGSFGFLASHASQVYSRLCQALHVLFALHRKHLGGRLHLVVPILQRLCNCLFSYAPNNPLTTSQRLPRWISSRANPLTATQAILFTRILTTLTQPTVWSLGVSRKDSNAWLTDSTKEVRQQVGRFVPLLLAHFCGMHLVGYLGPEMRQATLPGIWACVEVVPREGLRAMNAGMGRDERAIWKGLWEEWVRVGGRDFR